MFFSSFTFSDKKYCRSILSPTEYTLTKSLETTFINAKDKDTLLNDEDRIDFCCRSLYKCDAHKHIDVNQTIELNIRHCDCERSFQLCLNNLNTSLSNEIGLIHSINVTKCFSNNFPIIKCIKIERYSGTTAQLLRQFSMTEREQYFKRCVKYELDQNQPKNFQVIDMPFNEYATIGTLLSGQQQKV